MKLRVPPLGVPDATAPKVSAFAAAPVPKVAGPATGIPLAAPVAAEATGTAPQAPGVAPSPVVASFTNVSVKALPLAAPETVVGTQMVAADGTFANVSEIRVP